MGFMAKASAFARRLSVGVGGARCAPFFLQKKQATGLIPENPVEAIHL
jgi:hypothetical protein